MGRSGAWADGQVGDVENVKIECGVTVRSSAFWNLKAGIGHERSGILTSQRDQWARHSKQIPSEDSYGKNNVRT